VEARRARSLSGRDAEETFLHRPEAFEEIYQRLTQFTESLAATEIGGGQALHDPGARPPGLAAGGADTVTSLAFAIDAKDHYTQGHSQKVSAYAALIAEAMEMSDAKSRKSAGRGAARYRKVGIPEKHLEQERPVESGRMGND